MNRIRVAVCLLLIMGVLFRIYQITNGLLFAMDSDLINEITFREASYHKLSFFPAEFKNSNEFFASRPIVLYWLFYSLLQDFLLAYKLEAIVMLCLLSISYYFLCRRLGLDISNSLLSVALLSAWLPKEIADVLFYTNDAYSLFALGVLWHIILFTYVGKYKRLVVMLHFMMAFLYGIVGLKMAMVFYIPLFIASIIFVYKNYQEYDIYLNIRPRLAFFLLSINIIAAQIGKIWHKDLYNPPNFVLVDSIHMLSWQVLSARIIEVLGAVGALLEGGSLLSPSNLLAFMNLLFVAVFVLWFLKSKNSRKIKKYFGFYILVIVCLMCVCFVEMLIGSEVYSYRYYFVPVLLFPVLLSLVLVEENHRISIDKQMIIVAILLLVNIASFFSAVKHFSDKPLSNKSNPVLQNVANYLHENKYEYVVASYWRSGIMKGYVNGDIKTLHSIGEGMKRLEPFEWMIDKTLFYEPNDGHKYALVLSSQENSDINDVDFKELLKYTQREEVDGLSVYTFYRNPYVTLIDIKRRNKVVK